MKDYTEVIRDWVNDKKISKYFDGLKDFFEKGFTLTQHPNKVYFGANKSGISFIMGGIYLLGFCKSGRNKGIWMLQDRIIDENLEIGEFVYEEVKSVKESKVDLFWLHVKDIKNLNIINRENAIWNSYEKASDIVDKTRHGNHVRYDLTKNKDVLTKFWSYPLMDIPEVEFIEEYFEEEVNKTKILSEKELEEKLILSERKPERIVVKTHAYKRNPYVVAKVLRRAQGFCELCKKKAPFIRESDGTPYLEIHHKKPLSENGEDTLENTIAVCPNCHRKLHYGQK